MQVLILHGTSILLFDIYLAYSCVLQQKNPNIQTDEHVYIYIHLTLLMAEIRHSVEVSSFSHYLRRVWAPSQVVVWDFFHKHLYISKKTYPEAICPFLRKPQYTLGAYPRNP